MAKKEKPGKQSKNAHARKKPIATRLRPSKTSSQTDYKADAGHYKPVALVGSNNKLSWDEHFIHLQCSRCNGSGQGMAIEYRSHLVRDYGEDLVAKFDATYRQTNPVKNWRAIIEAPHYAI